ncbi:hypothetical protein PRIEUP_LOCUS379 [Pristimantis euphronides]
MSKTPTPAPADDTSGTDDSDSDEEPETKALTKPSSRLNMSAIKTPSTSAATGKTTKTPLQTAAADGSDTDDSDSDSESVPTKMTGLPPATDVKTPSIGAKQPMMANTPGKAGSLLKVKADDSSESEDSDSDEVLGSMSKETKSSALTPASRGINSVVRIPADLLVEETSEDSDSDDEQTSAIKAPGPTISTPSAKLRAAATAHVLESDADSESSDSSDSEEKAVCGSLVFIVSEHLCYLLSALPLGTPNKTKPTIATKGKEGISAPPQPDEESSSEDSDTDTEGPKKSAALGSLTPKQRASKLSLQPEVATKNKTQSPAKPVPDTKTVAAEDSSDGSDSSDSEDKPKVSMQSPLLTSTPSIASCAKGKAGLPAKSLKAAKTAQVSATESGKESKRVGTPAKIPKAAAKKDTAKASKVASVWSVGGGKAAALKQATDKTSSDSFDSRSLGKETTVLSKVYASLYTSSSSRAAHPFVQSPRRFGLLCYPSMEPLQEESWTGPSAGPKEQEELPVPYKMMSSGLLVCMFLTKMSETDIL